MIQRIQSLYLLLTEASLVAVFFLPLARSNKSEHPFMADSMFTITDHIGLITIFSVTAILCLLSIFLFNNRSLQVKTSYVTLLLCIATPAIALLLYYNYAAQSIQYEALDAGIGVFFFIPAILFLILAIRNIRKDEQLVKSMDRLR
jgi:hypothetical protein